MNRMLSRRTFLERAALLAAGICAAPLPSQRAFSAAKEPWFRISISEWSFHRALFGRKMKHLDFARVSKEQFGIEALEYVNQFFMNKARNQKFLAEMKKRTDDLGVTNVLILCDDEGDLGHADPKQRSKAVENHFKWVEAAKFLGCHAIRLNAYSTGTFEEQLERCADGVSRVVEFGAKLKLNVLVENHGQISSDGKWVAALMKKINQPNCGTLPDFGNFEKDQDRYQEVAAMIPWAKGVSAKTHDFDADGNEIHTDFRRMMKIVKDAGYRGYVEAEYEGEKISEPDGVRATKKLLEKVRDELA